MKFLKRLFIGFISFLVVLIIALYVFDYDYLLKAVRTIYFTGHTTAYLEDYKKFDNTRIEAGNPQAWPQAKNYNMYELSDTLQSIHKAYGSIAYIVIKNDSIVFEEYYDGFGQTSKSNSFSMAKSYVSAMLGKAIMQGYIESLDQPVGDFIPEYTEGTAAQMTVGDLASMASGLNWDESYYSPFSVTTRAYFDDDLESVMLNLGMKEKPGAGYKYLSGNTQLLAMVLERATGRKLADYLSESLWKPLGANKDALWQLDSEESGLVKAYCCIASNALDFARLGKLYKDYGNWNGTQILDSTFVAKSIKPRFSGEPYGYGFWLKDYKDKKVFMMRGHLGQYVMVIPEDDLIVVRLGHSRGKVNETFYPDEIDTYLEEAYKMN
ncbi:CubicO group peptidase (beta-lactamase class C family) [Leeuwenhoekiella aestuarii]|uniref:CubicO group peptidase (Beta-lactamase class C family) n=1 Tax=Leeuwenhoekiella aestuarii TaxID=2249426 RepID=A0A4Q0NZH5_9FLAO|nr:serine hydrolase [Leeuwenhoekiella aestuarii]RXG17868.1 CubicO group peptidase (beta-lactamase class C family) [Leeuwenhoekiella aestuarii]RXG19197.1 CubicO group peptidase (beta-lactamase class C family) [Leeuwenhoekiella aestuarii]